MTRPPRITIVLFTLAATGFAYDSALCAVLGQYLPAALDAFNAALLAVVIGVSLAKRT